MKGAIWGNVLDSRIVAEKVLRGDALDFRILNDGVQRNPEPLDVAGVGLNEDVQVLREARQPVNMSRILTETAGARRTATPVHRSVP